MKRLGDFLPDYLKRRGLSEVAQAAKVVAEAQKVLGHLGVPVSFRAGQLKIAVSSSASSYLLKEQEKELVEAVNERLGKALVKTISTELQRT